MKLKHLVSVLTITTTGILIWKYRHSSSHNKHYQYNGNDSFQYPDEVCYETNVRKNEETGELPNHWHKELMSKTYNK